MDTSVESSAMQFKWSSKKYTPRDLIALRKDKLPVIVHVAEGYSGSDGDDTHDIAAGAVFFIYAIEVQSRIVARTEEERYLSVARSCPVNCHVILNDGSLSEPCPLSAIVQRECNSLGDLRIRISAPEAGGLGPLDAGCSDIQGPLRVLDLYDERYLLGHAFFEGAFSVTEVVSIPSYLPLMVYVAIGCKHGTKTDFKQFLNQINTSALKSQKDYAKEPRNIEEIVVFSDPPNGDYEYIEPSIYLSRIPSFKIVETPRNTEMAVFQSKSPIETAGTQQGEFATMPRLPPRNAPRSSPTVEHSKLEEKDQETRITWTISGRRPLPPVPDQTGRGSSFTEECVGQERTIVKYALEARKSIPPKKSFLPFKKESRSLKKPLRSPSGSPKPPLKFGNVRTEPEEVVSDPETLQRVWSTGNTCKDTEPCRNQATSGQKPEVHKNNPSVSWSSWPFSSLMRYSEKSTSALQKSRPPVPKKSWKQPTMVKNTTLTNGSPTGTLKGLDESFISKNCAQRPGTLTLGQLDLSGPEDDYDEIVSPLIDNRLSQVDHSCGTAEETLQKDCDSDLISSKKSVADNSETLSLWSIDTGCHSGGKSDSENEDLDSSYEEISPPPRASLPSTITSDRGVSALSAAPTNVSISTPTSGVHNFINTKDNLDSSRKNFPDTWLPSKQCLSQARVPLPQLTKQSWQSVDDVPINIASLSVEQVSTCLAILNLGQYVSTFREQQIDGALLSCLDKDVLVSDFGFRKFDAIKLAKFARDGWRPKVRQEEADTSC